MERRQRIARKLETKKQSIVPHSYGLGQVVDVAVLPHIPSAPRLCDSRGQLRKENPPSPERPVFNFTLLGVGVRPKERVVTHVRLACIVPNREPEE